MFFEWNKSCIELIALYVQPKDSLRSHVRAIVALDHSRLSVENKFLENKSGRIFCVRQVYKFLPINLGACKPIYYFFYTPHLRRKSTMRRSFYHTDLAQNAVVHNFSRQIAFFQYSGPSKHAWTLSETVQKFPKSPIRPAGSNFWQAPNLQRNFKRVTLQRDKEFIESIFY